MLFMVANSNVVSAGFADPPIVSQNRADVDNGTPPAPSPPLNDTPERDTEPGSITQSWDNASIVSGIVEDRDLRLIENDTQLVSETPYGNFVLNKDSPYFVGLSGVEDINGINKVADSAFSALFKGSILEPVDGKLDSASRDLVVFHYSLVAGNESTGQLNVTYEFKRGGNKISASFVPSIGSPEDFQIAWLTFTTFDILEVSTMPADIEQRFEDLQAFDGGIQLGSDFLPNIGTASTVVKPTKGASQNRDQAGLHINLEDAQKGGDWSGTYAGTLTFGNRTGNAVVSTFAPGHLTIDPTLILSSVPQDATSFSLQRKTFSDGERYWLFWKVTLGSNPTYDQIDYESSIDGRTWATVRAAVTLASGNHLTYNFAVTNNGKTVAILWYDSASTKAIQMRTGLIAQETILWDDAGHQLYLGGYDINRPVSAAFTSQQSMFAVTWGDTGGGIGSEMYICTGQGSSGFSPC